MEEVLQAGKDERKESPAGYRSGYYTRSLVTRVGKLELRVPQDRGGQFRTEVFERYQRSEKALVASLMETRYSVTIKKLGGSPGWGYFFFVEPFFAELSG
jgi:transposase-like protein